MNEERKDVRTTAQRYADAVTWFCGSWHFFTAVTLVIAVWCGWQAIQAFDPYPYILLNLFLTIISTLQGPLIMMSQNRQAEREHEAVLEILTRIDQRRPAENGCSATMDGRALFAGQRA